jgi:nitrogen PTS system EIIA component
MQLGVRDISRILKVSEKTVYRWIKQGAIPVYRVQDQYRIRQAELLEWVNKKRIQVSEEIYQEEVEIPEQALSLRSALEAGGVVYRVGGHDKESVMHEAVQTMRLPDGVDREYLYRLLLAREKMCPTGVGDGIAIPHPRSPIVFQVAVPYVTLCFLEKAVEFGAMDGQPVRVLFTLVSPTVRAHLQLLSRIAFALHDPAFKQKVLSEAGREAILQEAARVDGLLDAQRGAAAEGSSEV